VKTRTINHGRFAGVAGVVTMLAIISIQPAQGRLFCGCCVEPGAWYQESREVLDFEFEIINKLKVYRVARINVTDASPAGIKGISGSSEDTWMENYRVSVSQQGRRWTLAFKKPDGQRGSLVFTLPKMAVRFGTDLGANVRKEPRDPGSIYKEVRFKGAVWGTGIFREGNAAGTKYLLALQGFGNNCMSESDFRNWTLTITGLRISYQFYGAFVMPTRT
jgi:hypothetical protein